MESKLKKYNIVSYVLTCITMLFFAGVLLFGISSLYAIYHSGDDNELGLGISAIFMVFFFLICLIPTICFSLGSIAFCISPLKNKYHLKANIIKFVFNILALVSCIVILLILNLGK